MPQPVSQTFNFVSGRDQLCDITGAIEHYCTAQGMPDLPRKELSVCLAEALNNILVHAYRHAPGRPFTVDLTLAGSSVTATMTDDGPEFDPRRHPVGVLTGLQEHGMGIHIYTSLMTSIDYQRLPEGKNQLSFHYVFSPAA